MSNLEMIRGQIPPTQEIRDRINATTHERKFLRELLKLAEKRDAVQAATKTAAGTH
jgi:hypothetical protein